MSNTSGRKSSPARGVAFDVIGLSYYPWWHGTLEEVETNLDSLARRYGKNIIIAETAYPWTLGWHDGTHNIVGLAEQTLPGYPATVAGQEAFLADLADIVYRVPGSRGRGIFYWAPDYIAVPGMGSPWENLTLFDFEGGVLPSASAFEAALRREDPEWPSRRRGLPGKTRCETISEPAAARPDGGEAHDEE